MTHLYWNYDISVALRIARCASLDYVDSLRFLGFARPQLYLARWEIVDVFFWS